MKHALILAAAGLTALLLLLFPEISSAAMKQSLLLCGRTIIPSLFPFLVLSNLCIRLDCIRSLSGKAEALVQKLFHLPGEATSALLFGFLCGFPVGAKTVATLYTDKHLQRHDAEQLLLFCSNAGPAFVFGVIGNVVFIDRRMGALLWGIHMFSAVIIGLIFRPKVCLSTARSGTITKKRTSYATAFVQAVSDAGNTMFQICFMIAAFSVIIGYFSALIPTQYAHSPICIFLIGMLELSSGVSLLSEIPVHTAFILSSLLLAWNGCCIHFQVLAVTTGTNLRLRKYFFGKLLHMIMSLLLSCMILL